MSEPASPPRVVYDCNIFVQALINVRGPAARCVEKAGAGDVALFVTPFILDEVRESWEKLPQKYGVTREQTELLASKLAAVATVLLHVPDYSCASAIRMMLTTSMPRSPRTLGSSSHATGIYST